MMDDKSEQTSTNDSNSGSMNIHIGSMSAAGHIVFAKRDAYVSGSTQGDGTEEQQVTTLGGVETSTEEAEELRSLLLQIERKIDTANLDPDAYDAAKRNAAELKQQITSQKKPNEHLLVQATEALLDFGPDIAGAVVAAFTTPLAGKITSFAGQRALNLYRRLRGEDSEQHSQPILEPDED